MTDVNSKVINLTKDLIARPSVTPKDEGCQDLLESRLSPIGFKCERMNFGEVTNLWARKGTDSPLLVFAGHTDVVPTGDLDAWSSDPFKPEIRDGMLYGRGTADMKGSIAAFIVATENFVKKHPEHKGSIGYLITSDEEGPAVAGTVKVVEALQARNEHIDYCLVGEPSSTNKVGDVVKNGRRGSMTAYLSVEGIQGHVAYPHLAENPVHTAAPFIAELTSTKWDDGNDFFPPTTMQIPQIKAGTGATNVIPGTLEIIFNFRFSTELTAEIIKDRVQGLIDKHGLKHSIRWKVSGQPFLTAKGELVEAIQKAIKDECGYETELSTAGGTSDGRFIAPTGSQVVELGPINATIHKVDECVSVADLNTLAAIYEKVLENALL